MEQGRLLIFVTTTAEERKYQVIRVRTPTSPHNPPSLPAIPVPLSMPYGYRLAPESMARSKNSWTVLYCQWGQIVQVMAI